MRLNIKTFSRFYKIALNHMIRFINISFAFTYISPFMIGRVLLMVALISLVNTCMDSNCIDCSPYVQNFTIYEFCNKCAPNFLANVKGSCDVNIAKIVSFIVTGAFIMASSFIVRWLLILYNTRKKRLYTAEYQQKIFRYMTTGKKVDTATTRAFVPITQRGLVENDNNQAQQKTIICDICKRQIQFTNKRVDTFSKCKHHFHSMCLRIHASSFYANKHNDMRLPCPSCQKNIHLITIYCQSCLLSHRDFEIKQSSDLPQVYSFTCFRCKAVKKDQKIRRERNSCYGLGKYLFCHCCTGCKYIS